MTVDLHREWGSVDPFGHPDWRTEFTPDRIAIVAHNGTTIAERADPPRAAFTGHTLTTPWEALHRAYFNGYALWTYMTTPFVLAEPELTIVEIAPVRKGDDTWRGLRATFPDSIATHSRAQEFYCAPDGLLRRHDYHVDVAGGLPPRSSSPDSSRHRDCAFRLDGAPTGAVPTCARSPIL